MLSMAVNLFRLAEFLQCLTGAIAFLAAVSTLKDSRARYRRHVAARLDYPDEKLYLRMVYRTDAILFVVQSLLFGFLVWRAIDVDPPSPYFMAYAGRGSVPAVCLVLILVKQQLNRRDHKTLRRLAREPDGNH